MRQLEIEYEMHVCQKKKKKKKEQRTWVEGLTAQQSTGSEKVKRKNAADLFSMGQRIYIVVDTESDENKT